VTANQRAVRLFINGRVQGVGFRWWCMREAEHMGVDGWVRNRLDGSVEAMAFGSGEAVEQLIQACRKGPAGAAVAEVHVSEADASEAHLPGFKQVPTA
jgi:acylphosphatase